MTIEEKDEKLQKKPDKKGGKKENKQSIPKQIAVMMVLNEVEDTPVNGGGRLNQDSDSCRRKKPQFLLVTDSRPNCKIIIDAFTSVFSTNDNENKKGLYDYHIMQRDVKTGLLYPSVENFIKGTKSVRKGVSKKQESLEVVQNDVCEKKLGSILS